MGIRKGVTVITGGGFHGKSTLLSALQVSLTSPFLCVLYLSLSCTYFYLVPISILYLSLSFSYLYPVPISILYLIISRTYYIFLLQLFLLCTYLYFATISSLYLSLSCNYFFFVPISILQLFLLCTYLYLAAIYIWYLPFSRLYPLDPKPALFCFIDDLFSAAKRHVITSITYRIITRIIFRYYPGDYSIGKPSALCLSYLLSYTTDNYKFNFKNIYG